MTIQYRECPKCGCRAPLFTGQDLSHCANCDGLPEGHGFHVAVEHNPAKTKWRVIVTHPDGSQLLRKKFPDQDSARAFCEKVSVNLYRIVQAFEGRGAKA